MAVRSRLLLLTLVLLAAGCMPVRYITQAAVGQERLNESGISIHEIIDGEHLDKRTRMLLSHVPQIKAFGERNGLKRTKNYERYIQLGRPAVVWIVSACEPLRFRPKTWKWPIIGSITYTGWFDRAEARAYADELERAGWDVDMRPSSAYSTLGYFDDPILSTMISTGDEALGELADVVLHETLHATFYVPGQSTLNESVASFFGNELAVRYLDEVLGPDNKEKMSYRSLRVRGERRGRLMKAAHLELAELYESSMPRAEKLEEKKRITEQLRADLGMKRPLTNATLIQFKTYGSGREEMRELFTVCGESFPRMLAALEHMRPIARAAPPHTDPAILLRRLLANGRCPVPP